MPQSTLTTPIADLTLTRTIALDAVTIALHDATGHPLYAETIALTVSASDGEPTDPEQRL